jgi:hypothetical protein
MVERETEAQAVRKQMTFEDYVEKWRFEIHREKGRLAAFGTGHDVRFGEFTCRFQYETDGWKLMELTDRDPRGVVPAEVRKEMFRCFAAHKARYLSAKEGCFSSPPGTRGEKNPSKARD